MISDAGFHADYEYGIYFALGSSFPVTNDQIYYVFGLIYHKIEKKWRFPVTGQKFKKLNRYF